VRSLLGYLLEEAWTFPKILYLACQRDGMLLAWKSDSNSYLRLLCSRKDLISAILVLSDMVSLTPRERTYLLSRVPQPFNAGQGSKRKPSGG
jgi:hypothetical protein